jgi:hypothetical protein
MDESQKREDFEYFFQTILESVPMIDCYEELYGFSFADRKDWYVKWIAATENDYEFYCVLDAISQEVPSFHTDLVEPVVDSYRNLHCFNSSKIISNQKKRSTCAYWEELVLGEAERWKKAPFYCFSYVDGTYVFDCADRADHDLLYAGCTLLEVDGEPIDEYIKNHLLIYNLYYDGQYRKPCRTKIVFNPSEGTPVSLSLANDSGETFSIDLYYSLYLEEAYRYGSYAATEDYAVYENNPYAYILLNSFSSQIGAEVSESLQNLSHDKIILDLRNCYGGGQDFAAKYLYPYLFNETHIETKTWYLPESAENRAIYNNLHNKLLYHFQSTNDSPYTAQTSYLSSTTQRTYSGGNFDQKSVIILTSQKTGSAADEFVSIAKKYGLATVVGNNTGGEGLAGSYMVLACPNSQLAFVYMPGGNLNPDGTDNSVFGTSPDIYISQSVDDFYLQQEMESVDRINQDHVQAALLYDTVLRYSVELLSQIER